MGLSKPADEILNVGTLGANNTATTDQVDLTKAGHFTVTVRTDFDAAANTGLTCYLRSSPDGTLWDTQDVGWHKTGNFDIPSTFSQTIHSGSTVQRSVPLEEVFKYMRFHIENNATVAANNISVTAVKQVVDPY